MKECILNFILGVFMIILLVGSWLGAAYVAWDLVDPNGFGKFSYLFLLGEFYSKEACSFLV